MWWKDRNGILAKEKQKELRREAEEEVKLSLRDVPKITFSLALANIVVFFLFSSQSNYESIILKWGFTPNNIAQLKSFPTFITHMFLHADILHILFNMLIFVQFGYLCERKIGMAQICFALLHVRNFFRLVSHIF